jgi:hypothetical protein
MSTYGKIYFDIEEEDNLKESIYVESSNMNKVTQNGWFMLVSPTYQFAVDEKSFTFLRGYSWFSPVIALNNRF